MIEDNENSVIMNVKDGILHNEVVFYDDGRIYLDGKEVIINEGEDNMYDIEQSTGGLKWYKKSKAPSKLLNATYKDYSQTWRWSNVNIKKTLKSITYATVISLLTGGCAGGVIGFTSTAFYELVNYEPASENLSYIDYLANGKSNRRYYKCKRVTYAKKSFAGKSKTTYSYAEMQ